MKRDKIYPLWKPAQGFFTAEPPGSSISIYRIVIIESCIIEFFQQKDIYQRLGSLGPYFCVWPMRAPDIPTLTNKTFENKFKRERKTIDPEIRYIHIFLSVVRILRAIFRRFC